MANRTKRTAKRRAIILATIARGYTFDRAARAAGVSRNLIVAWRAEDPQFALDLEDAYQAGTESLHDDLLDRARLPDHDGLAIFLLKQRDPRRYNQKMIEVRVAGDPDAPIGVAHSVNQGKAWIFPQAALERPDHVTLPGGSIEKTGAGAIPEGPIIDAVVEDAPKERDPDEALDEAIEDPESEAA
jgi:hypothetical protein